MVSMDLIMLQRNQKDESNILFDIVELYIHYEESMVEEKIRFLLCSSCRIQH